ncbi:MAG: glycosyltransferase family 39 protein [Thaumarchaeota archaeon]|nr:glycosyltransferase family 39 protein [Nitrososphaerota archaeon]
MMFVIFSLSYSLITPAYESPDEETHFANIFHLYWGNSLDPYFHGRSLYYFVLSEFYGVVPHNPKDVGDPGLVADTSYPFVDKTRFHHGFNDVFPFKGIPLTVHILRLFSIFCGVITIIYVYKIAKVVFTSNKWLPLFPMAFVSLIPTFIWMNSVVDNDPLLWTMSTIAIYYLIKFVTYDYKLKFLIISSIFIGLAIFTKDNGYVLYPLLLISLSYLLVTKQIPIKHYFRNIAIFFTISIFSGGWVRPLVLIDSLNPNNFSVHKIIQANTQGVLSPALYTTDISPGIQRVTSFNFLHGRLIDFAMSGMGQNVIWIDSNFFFFFDALLLIALIGIVVMFTKKKSLDGITLQNNHLLILFCGPILILSIMLYHWLYNEIGLARYTFPVIACFGMLFSIGFYRCVNFKKYLKVLVFIPLIFLIIANLSDISAIRTGFGVDTFTINSVDKSTIVDSDLDGISDNIDTEPNTFSNSFNDSKIGGTSAGYIVNRDIDPAHITDEYRYQHAGNQTFGSHFRKAGEQTLHIYEDPQHLGIHINVEKFPGGEPAQVNICHQISTLYLHPTDDLIFSCNNSGETIRVVVNYAMTTFMDGKGFLANANIHQGNGLSFDPSTHTFSALGTNNEKITVYYKGTETILEPGNSKIVGNSS